MKGNARETYMSGGKVPGECRGMQGDGREYRGMPGKRGNGCKVPGECWGMQGKARGMYGSWCKRQGNAGEFKGMPEEHMGMGV